MVSPTSGVACAVYVGDQQYASTPRPEVRAELTGIVADRHHGFVKRAGVREKKFHPKGTEILNSRQWSAVSAEELAQIAAEMQLTVPLEAGWLGANLLTRGVAGFSQMPPMTRLVFPSGATLLVSAQNKPCVYPAQVMQELCGEITPEQAKRFVAAALGRRGLVGWVERAGIIRTGDTFTVFSPPNYYTEEVNDAPPDA